MGLYREQQKDREDHAAASSCVIVAVLHARLLELAVLVTNTSGSSMVQYSVLGSRRSTGMFSDLMTPTIVEVGSVRFNIHRIAGMRACLQVFRDPTHTLKSLHVECTRREINGRKMVCLAMRNMLRIAENY